VNDIIGDVIKMTQKKKYHNHKHNDHKHIKESIMDTDGKWIDKKEWDAQAKHTEDLKKKKGLEDITKEQILIEFLEDDPTINFVMYSGCLTNGLVKRTNVDGNLCSNPECKSCQELTTALKREADKY
jgi:hypothetical protein